MFFIATYANSYTTQRIVHAASADGYASSAGSHTGPAESYTGPTDGHASSTGGYTSVVATVLHTPWTFGDCVYW